MSAKKGPFAKKSLGQNFLVDKNYVQKIISAVNPTKNDTIIEIGPGRGAITEQIIPFAGQIICVELDREFVPMLEDRFFDAENFSIVEGDATAVVFADLLRANKVIIGGEIKLIANLPYYISTAILQRLIEQREIFSNFVLMFQREVAARITAEPGSSDRGFLTVLVENAFTVTRLFDVPPTAFRPQPKVWSSVVRLVPRKNEIEQPEKFRELVSLAFRQKRKTILNNLKDFWPNAEQFLAQAEIDSGRRAETLTREEWLRLVR